MQTTTEPQALSVQDVLPMGRTELITRALKTPVDPTIAWAAPHGGSTLRFYEVNASAQPLRQVIVPRPGAHFDDMQHAFATAAVTFGRRPRVGAVSIPGPVPERGPLKFTNIRHWPAFDRDIAGLGARLEWLGDGPAGTAGLELLGDDDVALVRPSSSWLPEKDWERKLYAIVGTGLNTGEGREDGHLPFAARTHLEWELAQYLTEEVLGYFPEWEDVISGGHGFRNAGLFALAKNGTPADDPFYHDFATTDPDTQGEVVTKYALEGHSTAVLAAQLVFGAMGGWLGSMVVGTQARTLYVSPGILGNEDLRHFARKRTPFDEQFGRQGASQWSAFANRCEVWACLRNPEELGALARAAQLLRESMR